MKIQIDRKWKKKDYTIGRLYIDGEFFCNTLEDTDRNLSQKTNSNTIKKVKIPGKTAIPTGTYNLTLNVKSPKFSKYEFYQKVCNGFLPRILDVPGFSGILIHCGSNAENSNGCVLVGYNRIKGGLTNSKEVFQELYKRLREAYDNNEKIEIEIY